MSSYIFFEKKKQEQYKLSVIYFFLSFFFYFILFLFYFSFFVTWSTGRSKAVVPELVLLFGVLWFILRGDLLYVLPCVILFLCFSFLLA